MILQSQLSKLSNRLFKEHGGRRIPEHILERDYCIAWFLRNPRDLFDLWYLVDLKNRHIRIAQDL